MKTSGSVRIMRAACQAGQTSRGAGTCGSLWNSGVGTRWDRRTVTSERLHFDGPMVAGGLGYSVDELLATPAPATFHTGFDWIDQLTGGIAPGSVWTVMGLSLIHISEPTRRTPISYAVF